MITQLHIQTALRNEITFLKKAYCTSPLKVADITENKKEQTLHLMMRSSSPGILDGDEYRMKIELSERSSLQLHTQSYLRLYAMKKSASQILNVKQTAGSSFCFLPHPVVPHEASDFCTHNKIFLSDDCSLIWGEVLTCGRKLSGEVFKFTRYQSMTEIFINNHLVIKENLLIDPFLTDINAIGQMEGYSHQATLICLNEKTSYPPLIKKISDYLSLQPQIIFGITSPPVNGLIIRMLGQKAEQLYDCLKWISSHIPQPIHKKTKLNNTTAIVSL